MMSKSRKIKRNEKKDDLTAKKKQKKTLRKKNGDGEKV